MDMDKLLVAIQVINAEIMKSPVGQEDLEQLKKWLLNEIHFIEQIQVYKYEKEKGVHA